MPVIHKVKEVLVPEHYSGIDYNAISYTSVYKFDENNSSVSPEGTAPTIADYFRSVINGDKNICDYIKMGGSFELCICLFIPSAVSSLSYLWCIADGSGYPTAIWVSGGSIRLTLKTGSSYAYDQSAIDVLVFGVKNWIKLVYTGTQYNLSLSTDGIYFRDIFNYSASVPLNIIQTTPYDCFFSNNSYSANIGPFATGIIYLNETYFKYNGTEIWRPSIQIPPSTKTVEFNKYFW